MEEIILVFDGGSRGNPGQSYGSYRIQHKGKKAIGPVRLRLGHGTNNEAEYQTLIAGLKAVLEYLNREVLDSSKVQIEVRGDSRLVLNQLNRTWKAKDARMRRYRDEAEGLLSYFSDRRLIHQSRARTVEILGH
ncbi:MAG: reverse transcriptase-like protein [Anaerolineales bacterium]|nr:reverse transcriptase-like protein [Anaerolineales bacterium]